MVDTPWYERLDELERLLVAGKTDNEIVAALGIPSRDALRQWIHRSPYRIMTTRKVRALVRREAGQ